MALITSTLFSGMVTPSDQQPSFLPVKDFGFVTHGVLVIRSEWKLRSPFSSPNDPPQMTEAAGFHIIQSKLNPSDPWLNFNYLEQLPENVPPITEGPSYKYVAFLPCRFIRFSVSSTSLYFNQPQPLTIEAYYFKDTGLLASN